MKKIMQFLFSVKNVDGYKIYTIFGIKVRKNSKNYSLLESLFSDLKTQIMASKVNYNLVKYKNCNNGKNVIIIGGGETLKFYQNPSKSTDNIFVGINRAYRFSENIKLDYLFCQDRFYDYNDLFGFINYNQSNCKKFIGHITVSNTPYRYRINQFVQVPNSELYILNNKKMKEIPLNITLEPFADLCGTVFSAIQFILYTNPQKIYLCGFDCNKSHLFEKDESCIDLSYQYNSWLKIKKFIVDNTLNIELISVNPVGLKGVFKDVYTQSYVDTHPELLKENIEIIGKEF